MSSPHRAPTVVTVLRSSTRVGYVLGTLLMLALGAIAFYSVIAQRISPAGAGTTTIAVLVGVLFGGLGVFALVRMPSAFAHRTLTFDDGGVAYAVSRGGVPFRVAWPELGAVSVSKVENHARTNSTTVVRLDLVPADPASFAAAHPEMGGIRRPDGAYRLPLGPNKYLIPQLAAALASHAGERDRGVVDDSRPGRISYT